MRKLLGFLLSFLWLSSALAQSGNVGTYGIAQSSGSFIAISVDGSGNFTIKNSIVPNGATAVPIHTVIPGSGTGLVFTADPSNNFTYAVSTAASPFGNVPVIGYAAGAISEIDINTGTGIVTAGAYSTTLDLLTGASVRQVATRSQIFNNYSGPAATQWMARSRHIMRSTTNAVGIVIATWYVNHSTLNETGIGGTENVTASIEYPPGTCKQIPWGGQAQATLQDNVNTQSDLATISIPIGAEFFIRVWGTTTQGLLTNSPSGVGAGNLGYNANRDTVNGEALRWSFGGSVPDQTLSCDAITSTDNATGWQPVAVVGVSRNPAIFCWGDSRAYGLYDIYNDNSTNVGQCGRVVGPYFAYINDGVPSQSATTFLARTTTNQVALYRNYATHLYSQMGFNDTSANTAAQLLVKLQSNWALFGATRILQATFPPGTTSSDVWTTTGNQTPASSNANRISFNTLARAGLPGTLGTVDYASISESSLNSGVWYVPASLCTITASITTTVLNVTATSCVIVPGMVITGVGMALDEVISNGTGTGGNGTYNLKTTQSIVSQTMFTNTATPDGIHEVNLVNQAYNSSGIFNPLLVTYP